MLPYGMKKNVYKIHPHNKCSTCASEPPLTSKNGRVDGKKEINTEVVDIYVDGVVLIE